MLTNTPVEDAVIASLDLDPRIPDAAEIAVEATHRAILTRRLVGGPAGGQLDRLAAFTLDQRERGVFDIVRVGFRHE